MLLQPYSIEELRVAWCNRLFLRCRTHRNKPIDSLAALTPKILGQILDPYGIHLLELATTSNEFQVMISLKPTESAFSATSKTKGRISKWLNEQMPNLKRDTKLAKGYFAVTLGDPDSKSVAAYLETQSEHHGYDQRARPPVHVQTFQYGEAERILLATDHAATSLRYHVVLATWFRRGVFTDESAGCVSEGWRELRQGFFIDKVSFVPDHVHIALTLHPTKSPMAVVESLMNIGQELMWNRYPNLVIKSAVERLWQPSAYFGSFGAIGSKAIKAYMHRWEDSHAE